MPLPLPLLSYRLHFVAFSHDTKMVFYIFYTFHCQIVYTCSIFDELSSSWESLPQIALQRFPFQFVPWNATLCVQYTISLSFEKCLMHIMLWMKVGRIRTNKIYNTCTLHLKKLKGGFKSNASISFFWFSVFLSFHFIYSSWSIYLNYYIYYCKMFMCTLHSYSIVYGGWLAVLQSISWDLLTK